VQEVLDEHVVHHRQARAATGHELLRVDPQQLGEDVAQPPQPGQPAIVAHVHAVRVAHPVREAQQRVGEVELLGARLAPGEVEGQPARGQGLVGGALAPAEGVALLR
jgi:hypothetical protein